MTKVPVLAFAALISLAACKTPTHQPPTQQQTSTEQKPAQKALPHAHIYPEVAAAQGDIRGALQTARREHKRVLLDFGGDWCGDCQVLNVYFHQPENQSILQKHFVLVDVNVGHFDQNIQLAAKYGVEVDHGVPALAVVRPDGKVLVSQTSGEFRDMRHMDSSSVHDFLEKWKPAS